jgi:uncharacterized membrane protein
MSPFQVRRAFPTSTLDAIERAVKASESSHRGQLRFVVEPELSTAALWAGVSPRQRAIDVFSGLRVWDTAENNGVLIYICLADRDVEIVADRGIDKVVGHARWEAICKDMEAQFKQRAFEAGSLAAIAAVGAELAAHFPANGAEQNEQPDRPVIL